MVGRGASRVPERWTDYIPLGCRMPGTRFIAFKVPLKESFDQNLLPEERFSPHDLIRRVRERQEELGLIIDLTCTGRYYGPEELPPTLRYCKILTMGHQIPNRKTFKKFRYLVRKFLTDNKHNDKLIGVHCTHGLNRTGYLVCRYLIDVEGMEPNAAIELFNKSRGHPIERTNYIQDLQRRALKKRSCEVKKLGSDLIRKKGSAPAKPQKQLVKPPRSQTPLAVPRNPGSAKKKQQQPEPRAQGQPQELGHRQLEQRQLEKLEQRQLEKLEQRQQKKLKKKLEQRQLEKHNHLEQKQQNHLEERQKKLKDLEQNHLEQRQLEKHNHLEQRQQRQQNHLEQRQQKKRKHLEQNHLDQSHNPLEQRQLEQHNHLEQKQQKKLKDLEQNHLEQKQQKKQKHLEQRQLEQHNHLEQRQQKKQKHLEQNHLDQRHNPLEQRQPCSLPPRNCWLPAAPRKQHKELFPLQNPQTWLPQGPCPGRRHSKHKLQGQERP